jgi:hypothetical protein
MLRNIALTLFIVAAAPVFASEPQPDGRKALLIERDRVELTAPGGKPQTAVEVRNAIVNGGSQLGWVVVGEEPGKLTLRYNKQDRHEVTLRVAYDAQGYLIRYVDSKNMMFESTADKGKLIHNNYNRWTANLIKYIGLAHNKGAL